ncbi:MAG: hypothetical protein K0S47_3833, partial [Herbinix sp.]|nr:hypothetical protein [Herbinix sp.]
VQLTPEMVSSKNRNHCPDKSGLSVQMAPEYAKAYSFITFEVRLFGYISIFINLLKTCKYKKEFQYGIIYSLPEILFILLFNLHFSENTLTTIDKLCLLLNRQFSNINTTRYSEFSFTTPCFGSLPYFKTILFIYHI